MIFLSTNDNEENEKNRKARPQTYSTPPMPLYIHINNWNRYKSVGCWRM